MSTEPAIIIVCDGCRIASTGVDREDELIRPWRVVRMTGWDGNFHCCSTACEQRLRRRVQRPDRIDEEE